MANKPNNAPPCQPHAPTVIVLHGLHQNPYFVRPLVARLNQQGFMVTAFRYYSLKDDITTHAYRLHQHLLATHPFDQPLHLVAHSLGGLVACHFLASFHQWQIGRVVALGSPFLGSVCADYSQRFLPILLGNAYDHALDGNYLRPPDDVCLGVIAGNRSFGLGKPLLALHQKLEQKNRPNDGTVFVDETYLPQACDHIVLPVTHTGLLKNATVAQQVVYFLKHGRFCRTA